MSDIAVVLTTVSMMIGTLWYILLVIRDRVTPVPASWLIFSTTMAIGLWSYWCTPEHSVKGNIGNFTGVVSTLSSFFTIVICEIRKKNLKITFLPFQKTCLKGSAGILVLWYFLRFVIDGKIAAAIANGLTQVLMTIGYVVLAERLWSAKKNTESLFMWCMIFLASAFALIPAIAERNLLGLLYAVRATITSAITVYLVLRILKKNRTTPSAHAPA